jgi:uncharacterized protein (TIGR02452 family)
VSARLRAIARDTVSIVERGTYRLDGGGEVSIAADLARAVAGTRLYTPDDALPTPADRTGAGTDTGAGTGTGTIEVTNETSLAAARRLTAAAARRLTAATRDLTAAAHRPSAASEPGVACLNFASARNPGGGFRTGAQAQEESLARASALYPCLLATDAFYAHHRGQRNLTYSDRVIYSPAVPVFRDDDGNLLPEPYPVSFLTAAAPNRSAVARQQPHLLAAIPEIVRRRAARVLAVAAAHGHQRLVLGAWGCGVFGNDARMVATAFAEVLDESRWFDEIVFAVLDRQPGRRTYGAFAEVLRPDG